MGNLNEIVLYTLNKKIAINIFYRIPFIIHIGIINIKANKNKNNENKTTMRNNLLIYL